MKNIVIFCDGTWNTADAERNGVPTPTNVVKLAQAVEQTDTQGNTQLLYYDAGIGSAGSTLRRVFDGATGTGISANIVEAYNFLVQNFEVGDKLFLFGFSRGAFTVRSLAGFIRTAGILKRNASSRIEDAFTLYRTRDQSTHPREIGPALFRRSHAVEDITPIHFIGVWDTVGALGNPLLLRYVAPRNRFHDPKLSRHIKHAYHALAIDELRQNFTPTLWQQQDNTQGQTLEQRWFVGVHSDIGGGYLDHSLSDIPLDWLSQKAIAAGLNLGTIELAKNPVGKLHKSWKGFYRLLLPHARPIGVDSVDPETGTSLPTFQTIDESVWERRRADASYRPRELEKYILRTSPLEATATA